MRALLPVITTRRPDRRDRGYLSWVALAGEVAHLPLESAPIDGTTHVLEIYVAGYEEPLVVRADPAGAPGPSGTFPLRLTPLDDRHAHELRRELFDAANAEDRQARAVRGSETIPEMRGIRALAPGSGHPHPTSDSPVALTSQHVAALGRATGGHGPMSSSRRAPGSLRDRGLADGRFILEALLGGGASGEVYRAMHTALRRPVAVKVLHPSLQYSQDYCARFYAEALAASQLDHRNVLRILDYGQEADGILYIVMELLEGRNLQQVLDEEGPMRIPRLVDVVSQACAGLGHAHDAGVVHRDIKPENVVVVLRKDDEGSESDLVKVCDFGIAHWVPEEPAREIADDEATIVRLPDSKKVVGTPAYMAPEQIRNDPVDARADVYALGVLLYELSTGVLPFVSDRPMEVLLMHVTERPKPPSSFVKGFDPDLENIILKALEKDPGRRYATVRALRADLRELVDDDWSPMTGQIRRVPMKALPVAGDFATNTVDALAMLTRAEGNIRHVAIQALAEALRAAISTGDVKLARELLGWLERRIADASLRIEEREQLDRAIRTLRDPGPARLFAGHLLNGKLARAEDAFPVLAVAGPVAARSLLDVRRTLAPDLEMRARFVSFLRATGPGSLPVMLGALETLTGLATRFEEALADDLLRAVPDVRSDQGGEIAVRFVRADKPTLAVCALKATVGFWGTRAHALILGVLDSTIDPVRIAAVEALQRLGAVDDWAIERLGRIVLSQTANLELRVAAASTLALAPLASRARVVAFLTERLAPPQWLVGSLINRAFGAREERRVLVALARSLLTLDPEAGRQVMPRLVAERPELRGDLDALLTR